MSTRAAKKVDKMLLVLVGALLIIGALTFSSAAVGLMGRGATHIPSVLFNHFVLGVGIGLIAFIVLSFIEYRFWRSFAPYIYALALILTALVFTPLGFEHGGGTRWLDIAGVTLQPSEILKVATILFASALFASLRGDIQTWKGLGAFFGVLLLPTGLLIAQPDFGTMGVIIASVIAIFVAAGARWRDVALIVMGGIVAVIMLGLMFDHARERLTTFLNPEENPQSEGWQIRQSLITIGSGELFGRGFGQGVQKFTYLPEPMGDSIFAVAGEEFGFVGASLIIVGYLALALRGFTVASRAPDLFGGLLAVGLSSYLVAEAFINIAAMLALAPLTGIPLTFMSQGGSAMLASLASAGLLLAVSRRRKSG